MFYRRLKDLREDEDKNQETVAKHLGLQRTVYGRYERGEREVPAWLLVELAKYYDTSADYLLGLSNKRDK